MAPIDKKEFAKATLDKNIEPFVVHISFLSLRLKMMIYPAQDAQIALLLAKKVTVPVEYADFADVFLNKLTKVLPKRIKINKQVIELKEYKQPSYKPIYSLGLVKLKTLNTYIKTNLANSFIWLLKSPAITPILFVCKSNSRLYLHVNY